MQRPIALAVVTLAVVASASAAACRRSSEPSPPAPPPSAPAAPSTGQPTVKIWISRPGTIEMDGRAVGLPEVAAALDALAKQNGVVIFGQDLPGPQPTPNVVEVLKMISDRSLDFRSSHDRAFKDLAPDHRYDKSYLSPHQ
jgi:hypothetical protein